MKVLYRVPYPHFFSQHKGVGGHIAHSLGVVEGLIEAGHDVVVLVHEFAEEYEKLGATVVVCDGENVKGFLKRQIWLCKFFRLSKKLEVQNKVQILYTRYSTSALPFLILDNFFNADNRILEVNSFGSQRIRLLKVLDRLVVSTSKKTILISTLLSRHVNKELGLKRKFKVIINGVSKSRFRNVDDCLLPKDDGFHIAFAGLIKQDYGIEDAITCAEKLERTNEKIYIHIYGSGPLLNYAKDLSSACDNIVFHGEVPFNEVPDVLMKYHALLYITAPKNSFQSPTKLFEYMAIGRPILACKTPQVCDVLQNGEYGKLFEISDPDSLYYSLLEMRENIEDYQQRALSAQYVARENHLWSKRVEHILEEEKL